MKNKNKSVGVMKLRFKVKKKRINKVTCKHKWEHIVDLRETIAGTETLGLFHKCELCGLESQGEILHFREEEKKKCQY